jgi:outer membrane receptor protein involved in Fe transport
MRFRDKRPVGYSAFLGVSALASIPLTTLAQELEEMVVTATRRETNLQDTPLSIQAFDAEDLELGGITNGRDLGIMVPNVVLNPGTGGAQANFYARGLPGVGLYVDGVWQDGFGFQQMNFAEMERVEVLRGPQGTLFGRNTNAGAVNMTTRLPADEFGVRLKVDVGEFERTDAQVAVDVPITDRLKTKFIGAMYKNDGFLEGLTVPWDFGAQDDTLFRADLLWEPTDRFSIRLTHNNEDRRGTDPKIHRMTRYDNSKIYAYNIMLGAFQTEANARCQADLANCAAVGAGGASVGQNFFTGTGWAPPPDVGFGERYTGQASSAFNYTTHTTNYSGGRTSNYRSAFVPNEGFGPGQVGKWQTKSDSMEDGITADLEYTTLTADWDITERLNFEAILSTWEQDQRQVIDFDGTEFIVTTDDLVQFRENTTIELHLSGSTENGRFNWLAGYYSLDEDWVQRWYRWGMWEFVVPNAIPGATPTVNTQTSEYVRQTAILLGLNGVINSPPGSAAISISGGEMQTANGAPVLFAPAGRYPWNFGFISAETLSSTFDDDEAWFGEATFGITEKVDITVGARFSDKQGGDIDYAPTDAFRTSDPDIRPQGNPFAGNPTLLYNDIDQPTIETYKFSVAYRPTDAMMLYATYAEGFTSAGEPLWTVGAGTVTPTTCIRVTPTRTRCPLPAELVDTKEIGMRSDWLDGRLRFNATYFDSHWEGMRVWLLPRDIANNTQPFPYQDGTGEGTADGFEFEVVWVPTDRLQLNLGLGLIDTNYIQPGFFDGVTGQYEGSPFAYAADESGTVGANYEIPLGNGGRILLVGNYGYMGEYVRDSAYQRMLIDANGQPVPEPAYGILNARFVYEPADRNFSVELWGKNLLDELYVNGGFDTRDTWGYDFAIVGRSREVGVSVGFTF